MDLVDDFPDLTLNEVARASVGRDASRELVESGIHVLPSQESRLNLPLQPDNGILAFQRRQLSTKPHEVERVGDDDADGRLPAEVHQHVAHAPTPRRCHHQDRWCRKVSQRAPDRHIDEQQSERRVLELGTRPEVVERSRQQQRRNRDGRRLSDERAQHRTYGERREPLGGE